MQHYQVLLGSLFALRHDPYVGGILRRAVRLLLFAWEEVHLATTPQSQQSPVSATASTRLPPLPLTAIGYHPHTLTVHPGAQGRSLQQEHPKRPESCCSR